MSSPIDGTRAKLAKLAKHQPSTISHQPSSKQSTQTPYRKALRDFNPSLHNNCVLAFISSKVLTLSLTLSIVHCPLSIFHFPFSEQIVKLRL